MTPPTRQVIQCLYCSQKCQRRNLQSHTIKKHPGCPLKIFSTEVSVRDYIEEQRSESTHSKTTEQEEQACNSGSQEEVTTPEPVSEILQVNVAGTSGSSQGLESLDAKINHIKQTTDKSLKFLAESLQQVHQVQEPSNTIAPCDLSSCKNIDDLERSLDFIVCNRQEGSVICKICHVEGKHLGVFHYNFPLESDCSKDSERPKDFSKLKYKISRHVESRGHTSRAADNGLKAPLDNETRKITENILAIAYKCLYRFQAHHVFSEELLFFKNRGVNIGDINHSKKSLDRIRNIFSSEIMMRVGNFIKKSPCVALVADKITIQHRTVDIIAIHCIVPDNCAEELVQCMIVAAPLVSDNSGAGIANGWIAALSPLGIKEPSQISSIGADGQYFKNNVNKHFLKALNETCGGEICVPGVWDQAHLLELAMEASKTVAWVANHNTVVNTISTKFLSSSILLAIEAIASSTGKPFLRPSLYSDTRWCAYGENVLKVFLNNLELYSLGMKHISNKGRCYRPP